MKQKVLIYLLRRTGRAPEVLVFEHCDFPEAGVQVPAGTVDRGESPAAAACRELHEEAGLGAAQARLVCKLIDFSEPEWNQHRHVFLFEPLARLPSAWSHFVHSHDQDEGMQFDFYWLPTTPTPNLAGGQHHHLPLAVAGFLERPER